MKIPQQLPQFKNSKTLLIVAGKQRAVFYLVHRGMIRELNVIEVPTPHYSDREGHFKTRGHGQVMRSGATYIDTDPEVMKNLLAQIKVALKEVIPLYQTVELFLFGPDYFLPQLKTAIPADILPQLRGEISGNFTYEHPLEIIKRLATSKPEM